MRIFLLICKKDKEKNKQNKTDRLLFSTGPAAPGWLGGELGLGFQPRDGEPAQRPHVSRLPWPLRNSLKLKCDRCHFDSHQVSGSGRPWQGLKRAQSGLSKEAGQAQPPWVPGPTAPSLSALPCSTPAQLPPGASTLPLPQPHLLLQNLPPHPGLSHTSAQTPCPAPPTSAPLFAGCSLS